MKEALAQADCRVTAIGRMREARAGEQPVQCLNRDGSPGRVEGRGYAHF